MAATRAGRFVTAVSSSWTWMLVFDDTFAAVQAMFDATAAGSGSLHVPLTDWPDDASLGYLSVPPAVAQSVTLSEVHWEDGLAIPGSVFGACVPTDAR